MWSDPPSEVIGPIGAGTDLEGLGLISGDELGGIYGRWVTRNRTTVEVGDGLASVARELGTDAQSVRAPKTEDGKLVSLPLPRAMCLMAYAMEKRKFSHFEIFLRGLGAWRKATPSWPLSPENLRQLYGLPEMNPRPAFGALQNRYVAVTQWADDRNIVLDEHQKITVAVFSLGSYIQHSKSGDRVASWPVFGVVEFTATQIRHRLEAELNGGAPTEESSVFTDRPSSTKMTINKKVMGLLENETVAAGVGVAAILGSLGLAAVVERMLTGGSTEPGG